MNLARVSVHHSRAVLLVAALVAAAGLVAGLSLPSSIYPPLEFPRIVAIVNAGTTPAESMVVSVARPIEQAIMEVPGIRRVRSRTFRGATEISAQFAPGTDMVVALQQAQSRIAELRDALPSDTTIAMDRMTPASFPTYSLNLTGGLSSAELHDYAYYVIRPSLARVAGVGHVDVAASDTREIEVIADPVKLLGAHLTISDLAGALRYTNTMMPAGRYPDAGMQHLVLASGLWRTVADIAASPVTVDQAATLRVRDVASVVAGSPDRTSLVVGPDGDAAAISVSQQLGANILTMREGLETELAALAQALPAGLTLTKTYDLAAFVSESIANVRDAIIIGGVLAIAILLLFLRNWRLTAIAACTLPLTVVSTFFFMWLFGESINVMSMGGIAVAIGLVIDDAVVVVENIHRRVDEGGGGGVEEATAEISAPVIGSTFTTVVVFAPLGMLSGVVGDFFKALSITLSVAVLISLVLALTLIPLLARAAGGGRRQALEPGHGARPAGAIDRAYISSLPALCRRPFVVALAIAGLVGAALGTYYSVGTGFLPAADEGGFVIDYVTPPGTALEGTDERMRRVEAVLDEMPEIATFVRRTASELGMFATQQNSGDILVRLRPRADRERSSAAIVEDLRDRLEEAVPDTEIEFVQILQDMLGDLEGNPTPVEVKVFGDDQATLERLSDEVESRLEGVDGLVDVVGLQRGGPEVTWQVDPEAAARIGLTVEEVSAQLANAWLGETASDLRSLDRLIPVRVRYPDAVRFDPARLGSTAVRGTDGTFVPASSLVRVTERGPQAELLRENLRQMALVSAGLENRDLGSAVAEVRQVLASMEMPVGYTWDVGGQYESQRQAFRQLLMVSGVATALVFVVLVIQFRRFTPAVLILMAAPLSLSGAFALLILSGTDLNVSSAMGLILLVGLAVKNGIVLLDFVDRRRAAGRAPADAVLEAARIRLRPILMTTLCTLFGLAPLAVGLGAGAELQKPLALAVIGGLALSTVVTLYLVPAGYLLLAGSRPGTSHA